MRQITYEGKQGWLDENTNEFFPKESLQQVTHEGKKGLYHKESQSFFPMEKPTSLKPTQPQPLLSEEQRTQEFGGIYKAPPKWIEPVKTTLETLGLIGGSAVGALSAPVAGPLTPAVSAITAGGGYALGKKAYGGLMGALGIETSPYARERKQKTPIESMGATTKDILEGALIEATGQGAGKIISKVATPIKQLFKAPLGEAMLSPESQELARIYKEFNIPSTPSDLMPSSKTLAIAEGVLGYRFVAGDVMLKNALKKIDALNNARIQLINRKAPSDTVEVVGNRIRKEAETILSKYTDVKGQKFANMVDDFTSKMGISGKYDVGKRFTETMSGARQVRHENVENLYKQTREMLPAKGEDIIPLSEDTISLAKRLMKEEMSKPLPLQDRKMIGILKAFGGGETKLPEGIEPFMLERNPSLKAEIEKKITPKLTWDGMKNTRSDLLEKVREIYKTQGEATKKSRVFSELSETIDRDMGDFAEKQGGDIWKTYSQARQATKEMHEVFDKDILKIMRSNPEDILNRVINKGEVTLLKQIRSAGGDDALVPLRQGFFKQTLDLSTSNGVLNPTKLGNSLKKMGTETLSELATPEQLSMLNKIVKSGQFFSEKQAGMKTVEFLETLSKTDASKIVDAIIKPNNTYNVKLAKKLLTPERLQEISSAALEKMLKMSGTGNYLPISSMKAWVQYDAPMKELLPPQTYNAAKDFLKGGQNMTKVEALAKNASQTGQVLLGSQIGAAVLGQPLSAAKLVIVPWMIAKMYVNPRSQAFLTRALKVDPVSAEGISLFTKAATIAGINMANPPSEEITPPPQQAQITTFPRATGGPVSPTTIKDSTVVRSLPPGIISTRGVLNKSDEKVNKEKELSLLPRQKGGSVSPGMVFEYPESSKLIPNIIEKVKPYLPPFPIPAPSSPKETREAWGQVISEPQEGETRLPFMPKVNLGALGKALYGTVGALTSQPGTEFVMPMQIKGFPVKNIGTNIVRDLLNSKGGEIMKDWQNRGFYARNMINNYMSPYFDTEEGLLKYLRHHIEEFSVQP